MSFIFQQRKFHDSLFKFCFLFTSFSRAQFFQLLNVLSLTLCLCRWHASPSPSPSLSVTVTVATHVEILLTYIIKQNIYVEFAIVVGRLFGWRLFGLLAVTGLFQLIIAPAAQVNLTAVRGTSYLHLPLPIHHHSLFPLS